jgi:isochorismate hydrolase
MTSSPACEPSARSLLTHSISELVQIVRLSGCPVVWIRQEFEEDLRDAFSEMRANEIRITIKGTSGCEIVPELSPSSVDTIIVKKRYSGFFGTSLDETLGRLHPDTLILAGINTHACIRTTAIDAYQRDWPVVLAADCIDSYDKLHHEISLKYMSGRIATVLTNAEIRAELIATQGSHRKLR